MTYNENSKCHVHFITDTIINNVSLYVSSIYLKVYERQ